MSPQDGAPPPRTPTPRTPPTGTPPDASPRDRIAGIALSHPDRVVFDQPRLTKADLARYHEAIAPAMLAELSDRPLSLLRLPDGIEGERFFQKHPGKGFPPAIRRIGIVEKDGQARPYAYVTDPAGLVAAVQMGTVEFHIWGARRDRLDRPDRLVFDLDPDAALPFSQVTRAAADLRDLLRDLGLDGWAMVTGGKGLHLVVPLQRRTGWDDAREFCHGVARLMAGRRADLFTDRMARDQRSGRIFIDWLRNDRGATAIAPFSLRARRGAPVAMPVGWDELPRLHSAAQFSVSEALERGWQGVDRPAPQILGKGPIAKLGRALARLADRLAG